MCHILNIDTNIGAISFEESSNKFFFVAFPIVCSLVFPNNFDVRESRLETEFALDFYTLFLALMQINVKGDFQSGFLCVMHPTYVTCKIVRKGVRILRKCKAMILRWHTLIIVGSHKNARDGDIY